MRRACLCSIHCVGSKSFSSQAKWTGNSLASNCWISAAPDSPAIRFAHVVSTSLPSGVTIPSPVTTTRLLPLSPATYIPSPPSTSSTSPVMNEAASEQRKRTAPATSSGSPSRPSGVFVEHRLGRLLGQHVGQLRLDVAGRDDVRAHVARAELARERLREADDPGLRGARSSSGPSCRARRRSRRCSRSSRARFFIIGRVTARQV